MAIQALKSQWQSLRLYKSRLDALDPALLLDKGYSITFGPDGHVLKEPSRVSRGDVIRTLLKNGEILSEIK